MKENKMFSRQVASKNAPEKYVFSLIVVANMDYEARYRKKHNVTKEMTFSVIWWLPLNVHEYAIA